MMLYVYFLMLEFYLYSIVFLLVVFVLILKDKEGVKFEFFNSFNKWFIDYKFN